MLSKSQARSFFLVGTAVCGGAFILLTVDTLAKVPAQTNAQAITPAVSAGKDLWDGSNCMGCHTILGEGAYYAPELTKVYQRRGEAFVRAMLANPEQMYPGQRRMQNYHFTETEISNLVAFLKWIGEIDLNGFPPQPTLGAVALPVEGGAAVAQRANRPALFNQLCVACHTLAGQGGNVGPALDGVGSRFDRAYFAKWLADPAAIKPGTKMPKLPLTETDIAELAAFLSELKN